MSDTFANGNKRTLNADDVMKVDETHSSKHVVNTLQRWVRIDLLQFLIPHKPRCKE